MNARPKRSCGQSVADLMTTTIYSCRLADSLQVVAELMRDLGCACLPVTDEEGCPVGMVTSRDICNAAAREELALAAIPVESAMSDEVVTCVADEAISAAVARMREHRVHRLPVVDTANKLIGLLSLGHVARQVINGTDIGVEGDAVLIALVGELADDEKETGQGSVTAA